jgi:two-component system, chemotaxis family, chemotaxis protein CheY
MKKILLVDDSTTIRNMLKTSLISEYEVIEAEHGKNALEKMATNDIDFFLLDVNMPVMDGLTLVKEIRKIPKYSTTPVVMLTTETKEERKEEGKIAGANGWIIKPCEPDKLLSVIKKFI